MRAAPARRGHGRRRRWTEPPMRPRWAAEPGAAVESRRSRSQHRSGTTSAGGAGGSADSNDVARRRRQRAGNGADSSTARRDIFARSRSTRQSSGLCTNSRMARSRCSSSYPVRRGRLRLFLPACPSEHVKGRGDGGHYRPAGGESAPRRDRGGRENVVRAVAGASADSTADAAPVTAATPETSKIQLSISRRARSTAAALDVGGGSSMAIDLPKPEEVLSFEFPALPKATRRSAGGA